MSTPKTYASIHERTIAALINIALCYVAFVLVTGLFLPNGGLESVWLMSAISFWFLSLLSAPWFIPPRDAMMSSVGALLILVTMDVTHVTFFQAELERFRQVCIFYSLAVAIVAFTSLFLSDQDSRSPFGRFTFRLAGVFGRGEILFTPPAFISVIGAYQANYPTVAWLLLLWVMIVIARPVENTLAAMRTWITDYGLLKYSDSVGAIDRVDHPNIIRVKLKAGAKWPLNHLFVVCMPDGSERFAISLFSQVQGVEVIGTALGVETVADVDRIGLSIGQVCMTKDEIGTAKFIEKISGKAGSELVGFVVENSSIAQLRFEVSTYSSLAEGDVVFAVSGGKEIFYQILDAETAEENFDQNPRGTHIVRASQLGNYSKSGGFEKFPWLPSMNTPLFSLAKDGLVSPEPAQSEFELGKTPSANVAVLGNIDELIEFHTAILGVTGSGKTELTLSVVRNAISNGAKVFCVDLTGEYKLRLEDLDPIFPGPTPEETSKLEDSLFAVDTGEYGAKAEKKALKSGIDSLRENANKQIQEFLREEGGRLAIFELTEISNTKATLRLTELYLSSIMSWARSHRKARQILIVLEEAHTIVPEAFSVGFDSETQFVVSKIGQIALQGRKYGVGLLLVTQRTALVNKTILSQCNTFFTHTLIDQTSLTFLDSVYSKEHTKLIPNLRKFEFLAFGKAVKSERPIMLRREFSEAIKEASARLNKPSSSPAKTANSAEPDLKIETHRAAGPRITAM